MRRMKWDKPSNGVKMVPRALFSRAVEAARGHPFVGNLLFLSHRIPCSTGQLFLDSLEVVCDFADNTESGQYGHKGIDCVQYLVSALNSVLG